MRNAFAQEITSLAETDQRIVLLSGDIGNRLFNPYKSKNPGRFFNCGVAEANMTSMAAGMAMCGLRPVTYTITPFNTYRCMEQIRVDVCYHNLPVIIVGVGAGLSYSNLGPTHHSCEDIAMLRSLPNMTIICPADAVETKLALRQAFEMDGPVYLRLGKKNEPIVHTKTPKFSIGKALTLLEGEDVCIIGTGTIIPECLTASEILEQDAITSQVVNMHTIKPLDDIILNHITQKYHTIITVEEHSSIGGLGSALTDWLSDRQCHTNLIRIGVPDRFIHSPGNVKEARKEIGLDAESIAIRIKQGLSGTKEKRT